MISIGTIGLIKGITTFDASKGARLATYAARCVENEILMHFRSLRKSAQDVSLSDYIDTGADGAPLELMDVVSQEQDLHSGSVVYLPSAAATILFVSLTV